MSGDHNMNLYGDGTVFRGERSADSEEPTIDWQSACEMWKAAHEKVDGIADELQDTVHKQAQQLSRWEASYNAVCVERDAIVKDLDKAHTLLRKAAVALDAALSNDQPYIAQSMYVAAEKELAELRSSMKFRTSLIGRTEAERDALRAKIETAENDAAHQKALAESALRVAEGWERKCDALRVKISEMERQKPVAFVDYKLGNCFRWAEYLGWQKIKDGTRLYALPGAKGEEK